MCPNNHFEKIRNKLYQDIGNICEWLVNNKLHTHFRQHEIKSTIFASKCKIKSIRKLNVKYTYKNKRNLFKTRK